MKRLSAFFLSLLLAASPAGAVGADGYMSQLPGTMAIVMANAFVAPADDPSAVDFTPAGLARQDSFAISLVMTPVSLRSEYTPDSGPGAATASRIPVVPTLYVTAPLSGAWTLGLGM